MFAENRYQPLDCDVTQPVAWLARPYHLPEKYARDIIEQRKLFNSIPYDSICVGITTLHPLVLHTTLWTEGLLSNERHRLGLEKVPEPNPSTVIEDASNRVGVSILVCDREKDKFLLSRASIKSFVNAEKWCSTGSGALEYDPGWLENPNMSFENILRSGAYRELQEEANLGVSFSQETKPPKNPNIVKDENTIFLGMFLDSERGYKPEAFFANVVDSSLVGVESVEQKESERDLFTEEVSWHASSQISEIQKSVPLEFHIQLLKQQTETLR